MQGNILYNYQQIMLILQMVRRKQMIQNVQKVQKRLLQISKSIVLMVIFLLQYLFVVVLRSCLVRSESD